MQKENTTEKQSWSHSQTEGITGIIIIYLYVCFELNPSDLDNVTMS